MFLFSVSYESSLRMKNKTFTKDLEMMNSTEFKNLEAQLCSAVRIWIKLSHKVDRHCPAIVLPIFELL